MLNMRAVTSASGIRLRGGGRQPGGNPEPDRLPRSGAPGPRSGNERRICLGCQQPGDVIPPRSCQLRRVENRLNAASGDALSGRDHPAREPGLALIFHSINGVRRPHGYRMVGGAVRRCSNTRAVGHNHVDRSTRRWCPPGHYRYQGVTPSKPFMGRNARATGGCISRYVHLHPADPRRDRTGMPSSSE